MPPLIITRGTASAKAFGFTSASLGASNFIAAVTSCAGCVTSITKDSCGNYYVGGTRIFKICGSAKSVLHSIRIAYGSCLGSCVNPSRIFVGKNKYVYVNNQSNAQSPAVYRINPNFNGAIACGTTCGQGRSWGLALDKCCNLYTSGIPNSCIPYLIKFSSTLSRTWAKKTSTAGPCGFYGITVDSCNNTYAAWKKNTVIESIVKFNACGNYSAIICGTSWKKTSSSGTGNAPYFASLSINSCKQIVAAGNTYSVSGSFVYVVQYNSALNAKNWAASISSACSGKTANVLCANQITAYDVCGNVYVTGYSNIGSLNVPQGWVIKFNSSGTVQWKRMFTYGCGTYNILPTALGICGNNYYITLARGSTKFILNLPTDGSKTGTLSTACYSICYLACTNTTVDTTATFSTSSCAPTISNYTATHSVCFSVYSKSTAIQSKTL
jgi:hypothetical protein